MALRFLGQDVSQEAIACTLETDEFGTPLSRVRRITEYGVSVDFRRSTCEPADILQSLTNALPVIVFVDLRFVPYASLDETHAVVVIGSTKTSWLVLDPAQDSVPMVIENDAFLAAWLEMDCAFAVLRAPAPAT